MFSLYVRETDQASTNHFYSLMGPCSLFATRGRASTRNDRLPHSLRIKDQFLIQPGLEFPKGLISHLSSDR